MELYGSYVTSRTKDYIDRVQSQRNRDMQKKRSRNKRNRGTDSHSEQRSEERFRKHVEDMAYRFAYGEEPPKLSADEARGRYRSLVDAARGR